MSDRLDITEETRTYEVTTYVDSEEFAEALRDIADVVHASGMTPSYINISRNDNNVTLRVTLKRSF